MPNPFRLLAPKPRVPERDMLTIALADGRTVEVQRLRNDGAGVAVEGGIGLQRETSFAAVLAIEDGQQ